jgi:hypothetical protein
MSMTNNELIEELEALADGWLYGEAQAAGQQGAYQVAESYEQCAKELREVIDDYE